MIESDAKLIKFPQDSVILKEGELNPEMYKIVKGNAELYTGYGTDRELLLGIIGPQACFGEFGLLMQAPSIYTVIAYSDIYAIRVTSGDIGDFVKENHKNIIDIMRNMAHTMTVMQKQLNMMNEEISAGRRPDDVLIKESQRNIRDYAVRNPNNLQFDLNGKPLFINISF
ncbi:MAG: Crp/Fnr family transcriptional regulator [Lachnospiraceae bacterium]|nr:Crp/Fnr family transcriptional regulator [Lachnospiraceae bacterium]MBR6469462.1 Crp/Fnr family transcriptional regulator [Lachnospiraceae bacterium]